MNAYFTRTTSAAPLAVFRVVLGLMLLGSIVRFWMNGWIEDLYIKPSFFFTYYGFEFVKPLGDYTYLLFAVCAFACILVTLGLFYRVAITLLFISFTYIELMDKSTYLNHYYFISMICLLMIFLPANTTFSLDAWRNKKTAAALIPQWSVDAVKLFVMMVYFFAGLAKLNSDWLVDAQPLRTWLPAKNDMPIIGFLFSKVWVAYAFSWIGCLYDLSIPFLLINRSTTRIGYAFVVIFHILTAMLFPIGMFPYVMIGTALIFFPATFHEGVVSRVVGLFNKTWTHHQENAVHYTPATTKILLSVLAVFFVVQVALPFRHVLYPGELFWTEQGYRFSWRVMLMEKTGYAEFTVRDSQGHRVVVNNNDFLTPLQEKMMAAQPDMILQYAHFLRDHYTTKGFHTPEVYVDSYVVVNGRLGQPMIDPSKDLARENDSFSHKSWILPFPYDIKGL